MSGNANERQEATPDENATTLAEAITVSPGHRLEEDAKVIRLFEHPDSGWSLPGAMIAERRDALRAILERGRSTSDTAYVAGFAMGGSDGKDNAMTAVLWLWVALRNRGGRKSELRGALRDTQATVHCWLASRVYPRGVRYTNEDLEEFRLGLADGGCNPVRNLDSLPLEEWGDCALTDVQDSCGITAPASAAHAATTGTDADTAEDPDAIDTGENDA